MYTSSVRKLIAGSLIAWLQLSALAALHSNNIAKPHGLLHPRQDQEGFTASNVTSPGNDTLAAARELVKTSQTEARERNNRLLSNPRQNDYRLRFDTVRMPVELHENGTVALSTYDGTGVNGTVGAALALVTEADAKNGTMSTLLPKRQAGKFWMESMVWRNVKDYGAVGDGIHDDTEAINKAISDGDRCGANCGSSTTLQAAVYFPSGTYLVSRSIVAYYFTQMIGDPISRPVIKVAPSFVGLGVISSDVYIEGGNGASWYINQGMFMENGSGGFMSDLEFVGGSLGAYVGNQQFTVRNLKFSGQLTRAIEIHWDWGWTWKGLQIEDCPIGILITGPDPNALGSAIFLDSSMRNVNVGIQLQAPGSSYGKITVNVFNLAISNVPTVVNYNQGRTLLAGSGGSSTIRAWGVGKRYDTQSGESSGVWQDGADYARYPSISPSLLSGNKFFERSKPQYENVPASSFVNLKSTYGAAGDGFTDDTQALNTALKASASGGRILWIPAGVYVVSDTIDIPPGAKVVGQLWSQIMGAGAKFSDVHNPRPVVRVGAVGDVGEVEIQDLLFTVRGATAGAIILQWNIREASPGSAAMWDTHVRVGGARGSDLQASDCPKLTGKVNKNCIAASMLVHITKQASAYFENTWFWVADHDLDVTAQTQIDIYVARGFLIESTSPVWLYGTASEHCVLYQYQIYNASNIFLGMIQTESPYYQMAPPAPEPFVELSNQFPADPKWDYCEASSKNCAFSWGVRILNSANIYIYGAGLYSWFNQYDQACVAAENCQDRIFEIASSSAIWIYSLITKASVEMISPSGGLAVMGKDNKISYCDIIMAWMGSVSGEGALGGAVHRSPASATVIPFPAVTVKPTETFTIAVPVVSQIDYSYNDGNQNSPPGPGRGVCSRCDLSRLITSTCCGVGGGVSNPIEISPGVAIPRPLFLPAGFQPNQRIIGSDGIEYEAGKPLPREVLIPIGTIFPAPFMIPPGLPLSNTWSPEARDGNTNGTLYIISDFWDQQHTVSCLFPCTLLFPPLPTRTTWTVPVITYDEDSREKTTTVPPYTTQKIRISRTTVLAGQPTQIIKPKPAKKPLCFIIPIINIRICPPDLRPFPPPIPDVTIIPIPPGGKPGPTNAGNRPSPEEEQEEEEEEEEERSCTIGFDDGEYDDDESTGGDSYPGAGSDNGPGDDSYTTTFGGAGFGKPLTTTVTVTPTAAPSPTPYTYSYGANDETTAVCPTMTTVRFGWAVLPTCVGSVSSTVVTPTSTATQPQPTSYDCKGKGLCSWAIVPKHCNKAADKLKGDTKVYWADGSKLQDRGACFGEDFGAVQHGCSVMIRGTENGGKVCSMTGNEIRDAYYKLRSNGGCKNEPCGSFHVGNGCLVSADYAKNCKL
ncbi:hypothetical protein NLG97_g4634 [Lecanicillium saksenae]|uniref:Uncharacterized protein n=1 Tax=Lecanicillium saksenae TaxID=468837 RepID=A0ACC1QYL5_9HYPO|nr:hypothetical protein NLG97_g4634 [Lecanicillium saksenae]